MLQTLTNQPGIRATETEMDVELRKVFKVFNGETAVRGVDLGIKRGEFFSILGPSGCGKTTTLRLVAGFETPSAGDVMICGQSVNQMPPYRRPVNTVFQSYALFNHLSVWDNIAFGLRIKKMGRAEVDDRVNEALHLVKMESFANRFPQQLSGGQQQRVALARALVNRPAVLLLDEPLGALDLKLRKQMQMELSSLHRDLGLTFVMVTHDQEEAMSMSDRIAVMHEGRIEQIGTPSEIYECPATSFVADFIGDTNMFRGRIEAVDRSAIQVRTNSGLKIVVQQSDMTQGNVDDMMVAIVRPEKVYLSLYTPETTVNCFEGRLLNIMYLGTHVNYIVELVSGDQITVRQPNSGGNSPDRHTPIYVYWGSTDCLALPEPR